jgi:DNA-binding transcriptional LysR family regulator
MFSREPKGHRLVGERYATSAMVIAAAARHPLAGKRSVSLREVAREPFVLREPESTGTELVRSYFSKKGLAIKVAMELASHEAIKVAVAEGLGLTVVARPWLANELALNKIALIKVPELDLSINHWVFHREGRVLSQAAKTFLQFLRHKKPEFMKILS